MKFLFFSSFFILANSQSLESALSSGKEHYSTAIRALIEIAKSENASAENNIGYAYEKVWSPSRLLGSIKRYKNASKLGLTEAKHNLGMLYLMAMVLKEIF